METDNTFIERLQFAITDNRLLLPTLPEVALRVRDALENQDVSAQEVAELIATDASLSVRLLRVVNSPLYRGRLPIDNVQTAIMRLGNSLVRTLVVGLVMRQVYQPTKCSTDERFRDLWEESIEIAALSRLLADSVPHLSADTAMLAGLIHNIGALPILVLAEEMPELWQDEERLDSCVEKFSPMVGTQILVSWNFPSSLTGVTAHHRNLLYDGSPDADYVDVVLVARFQATIGKNDDLATFDWQSIPAFRKLGIDTEVDVVEMTDTPQALEETRELFLN